MRFHFPALLLFALALTLESTAQGRGEERWRTVTSSEGAFEIDFPGDPEIIRAPDVDDPKGPRGRIWAHTSRQEDLFLMTQYLDFPPGQFAIERGGLSEMARALVAQFNGTMTGIDSATVDGRIARRFHGEIDGGGKIAGQVLLRGNRIHFVMSIWSPTRSDEQVEYFHRSFKFIEPRRSQWIDVSLIPQGYEMRMPSTALIDYDTLQGGMLRYMTAVARDNNTGQSYWSAVYEYSPYYAAESLDSHMLQNVLPDEDWSEMRLVRDSQFTIDGHPAREVVVARGSESVLQRMRLIVRGRRLYELTTIAGEPEREALVDSFFTSFRFVGDELPGDVVASKWKLLLADIQSSDSLRRAESRAALRWYEPKPEDLPGMLDALSIDFADNGVDAMFGGTTTSALVDAIAGSGGDEMMAQLIERYHGLPESAKTSILNHLLERADEESVRHFVDLALATPATEEVWGNLYFWRLNFERERYASLIFPRLYALLDSPATQASLLRMTSQALIAESIDEDDLEDDRERLLGVIRASIETSSPSDTIGWWSSTRSAGLELLTALEQTDEVTALIARFAADTTGYLSFRAVDHQVKSGAEVRQSDLRRLLADPYYRLSLYWTAEEAGRLELIPAEFRTQSKIIEGHLHSALYDADESIPDSITLVESRIVEYDGKRGRAYLYRVPGAGEDAWYHTILIGLQPVDESQVSGERVLEVFGEDRFEEYSVDEHFDRLLEQAEAQRVEFEQWKAKNGAVVEEEE